MRLLDALRRLVLVNHEQEHRAIDQHLSSADDQLNEMEVRVRRLEIERRLRERRLDDR